jgi:hypothetical protein
MTVHEPNEYGFSGAGTGPAVEPDAWEDPAEEIAVPEDDLVGPLADAFPQADGDDRH